MSTAEALVLAALSDYANLTALVSDRIYAEEMPQSCDMPVVVYYRIGGEAVVSLDGDSGLDFVRFQIDSHCSTLDAAKAVSMQVRAAMDYATRVTKTISSEPTGIPLNRPDPKRGLYTVMQDFRLAGREE